MTLPQPPGPDESILARWVRGAIVLAVVALAVLLAVVMWQNWRSAEEALATAVDTDMAGLADIYASGGEAELVRRLNDRTVLASLDGRRAHYLLGKAGSAIIAGNLKSWPPLSPAQTDAGFITTKDGTELYARATRLGPELDLVVAREYGADRRAIRDLALLFLAAGAAIVLVVWWIGRRAAARMRRRLARISDAFREAECGGEPNMPDLLPRDEIGELAELSTRSITRAANLAATHRHMSDHIAHEIRTPLTHLDHRLVSVLGSTADTAQQAELEKGRADIRSVVAMLDSLLDIAASEARVGALTGLKPVDLSALAEGLVELYEASAEEAGIALKPNIAPDVVMQGEVMQMTRLISNLLDNALKYVPRGGTVRLVIAVGPVIEVSDDGPGIEPQLRGEVFDRFRSGSQAAAINSHGLGLALARAIAQRHGLIIGLVPAMQGAHFRIAPQAIWTTEGLA